MRFLFVDRITRLKGHSVEAIATFSISHESLRGHFERRPVVPGPLLVEAIAQVLGWAIIHHHDFRLAPILSLFQGARFAHPLPTPGFNAQVGGEIITTTSTDSLARGWMRVEGHEVAAVDRVIYSHQQEVDEELLRRQFAVFDARGPAGNRDAL